MNITIKRTHTKPDFIVGKLLIDGEKICHTLENPNSCLPAGSYPVTIVKCRFYNRKMPIVGKCGDCTQCKKPQYVGINTTIRQFCPMLKPGNGVHNRLDGSILVGDCEVPGCILHPRTTFQALYQRIRKSIERQKQREQNRTCSNYAESRTGVDDSQRGNQVILRILRDENKL